MTTADLDGRLRRRQLGFAAAGVLVAAADTYVVVVALPSIMGGVGVGLDQLQHATPVITGFLLGYVAVLPLLGRLADLVGKRPVFTGCLIGFAGGSLLTATAHALPLLVAGRALQGLGGGGLVPVTLALVAERWPPEHRGLPLGLVGGVQELGSVIGPLYGAAIVAVAGWRWIFWLNLPVAAIVAVGFVGSSPRARDNPGRSRASRWHPGPSAGIRPRRDTIGATLAVLAAAGGFLSLDAPGSLAAGVTTGRLYAPVVHGPTWSVLTTPMAIATGLLLAAFAVWEVGAAGHLATPLVDVRAVGVALRRADVPGAVALAVVLGCVVIAFSTTDPGTQVVGSDIVVVGPIAVLAAATFAVRQRTARRPLLAPGALSARPAWGAVVVNLFAGAALIAALVDVPLFARATTSPNSQTGAALVLLRFLAAVPVGAVAGGLLVRAPRRGPWTAGAGLAAAAIAFTTMTSWPAHALVQDLRVGAAAIPVTGADIALVVCGLGFGLAIAPVNAAVLAAVDTSLHGLASSLVVVARTIGMLVGISALTAVALHRFYAAQARIGSPLTLCPSHPAACPVYDRATSAALLSELHTIFGGAALSAVVAAVAATLLLRPSRPVGAAGRRR